MLTADLADEIPTDRGSRIVDDAPITTDIPDPEALAIEVARLRSVVRDLIKHLGSPGTERSERSVMEHFLRRMDQGER